MRTFTAVAALIVPALAAAQVYKWTDADGHVHYGQAPPKTGNFQQTQAAPPPGVAPNVQQIDAAQKQADKDAGKTKEDADKLAAEKAQKAKDCKAAQERLTYLDAHTARRIGTKDAQGNVSRMTEDEFQKQRQQAQESVTKNCN